MSYISLKAHQQAARDLKRWINKPSRMGCKKSCLIPAEEQPTFERAVKKKASCTNGNISAEANGKDTIMTIF
jgi:hypothetical protein